MLSAGTSSVDSSVEITLVAGSSEESFSSEASVDMFSLETVLFSVGELVEGESSDSRLTIMEIESASIKRPKMRVMKIGIYFRLIYKNTPIK